MDEQDQPPRYSDNGTASGDKPASDAPPPSLPPSPRGRRHHSSWLVAIILIVAGVALLVQNVSGSNVHLQNWWALFILIPAFGSFADAWRRYVGAGRRLSPEIARPLTMGLVFVAVTATFIFAPNHWEVVWPVFLIIIGLGLAFSWRRRA
jgi:drug/metabolite transporter (DMT)-like permease